MTWTSPTPVPPPDGPLDGPERPILEAFLGWQRHTLLNICADLTGEQLAQRAIPPSPLSLLGLVRHLAKVERIWFRQRVAGEDIGGLYGPALGKDTDFDDLDPARAAEDFARYADECRLGDVAVAELSLEHTFVHGDETYSLRLVYNHLIAEYARHLGHADLLRQVIDGLTGG